MAEVSADEASGGFFTSKSAAGNSTLTTTRSTTGDDERNMSEAAFAHWKTELTNRIVADEEKRAKEERKAFKEKQDALFWQRKKQLHQKTKTQRETLLKPPVQLRARLRPRQQGRPWWPRPSRARRCARRWWTPARR